MKKPRPKKQPPPSLFSLVRELKRVGKYREPELLAKLLDWIEFEGFEEKFRQILLDALEEEKEEQEDYEDLRRHDALGLND